MVIWNPPCIMQTDWARRGMDGHLESTVHNANRVGQEVMWNPPCIKQTEWARRGMDGHLEPTVQKANRVGQEGDGWSSGTHRAKSKPSGPGGGWMVNWKPRA